MPKLQIKLQKVNEKINFWYLSFWGFWFLGIYLIKVHNKRVDFPCYYTAGKRFFNAENLYIITDQWPYKYLPSAAFFFQPFAIFNYDLSKFLFYCLCFLSMVLTYHLILKILFENQSYEKKYLVIPFILSLRFHFYDFSNLQINSIMLFLILVGYQLLSQKKYIPGSLLFAIGGMFKIIPLFLSFFFLLKGKVRAYLSVLVAFLLILLVPILFYGVEGFVGLFEGYFKLMDQSHSFYSGDRLFQSLPSMIFKYTSYFNIFVETNSRHLLLGLILLLCTLPLGIMISKKIMSDKAKLIEFSYCCLFFPLVNPVGWRHSHIFIIPAVVSIFYYVFKNKLYLQMKYQIFIFLYLFFNVLSSKFIAQKKLSHLADHLSFNVMALFVLFFLLMKIHSIEGKEAPNP